MRRPPLACLPTVPTTIGALMDTLISKLPWIARLPGMDRMRSRPIPALIGIVALLLAVICGVIALVLNGGSITGGSADTHEVVNSAGQYRFDAPDGWTTTQDGRTTTVTSPDKETVVTLGVGGVGPIPNVGTQFFQEVASHYKNVQVIPPEAKTVGSRTALIYGGVGDNEKNTSIRFLAITVENNPANYAIAVFTAADSDPKVVLPPVNHIVDSFRPATGH
ncbi:MAG TPA: hypothetical protein VFA63_07085 [Pseudonocardiaceae bacterium]|jgi:hypothetical protein|nr:hypothetical protein [Pseudonocardiaceae bacterium]